VPIVDNNTIYILDKDTYCLREGVVNGCTKSKASPFTNTTDTILAIHRANKSLPIKLVVSTDGGLVSSCHQILRHLRLHPAGYVAYCNEAISAGSILTIGADEIVMNNYSRLGKIDPIRMVELRVFSTLYDPNTTSPFPTTELDIRIREGIAVLNSCEKTLRVNVPNYTEREEAIKTHMIYSDLSHFTTFGYEEVRSMGFNVRLATTEEENVYFGYFQS
jgi:membrane-bound ClpP family serine protease